MSVRIRPAEPADDAALTAIDTATWSTAVTPGGRPAADEPFFGPGREPADVLVAEIDGDPVGYVLMGDDIPIPSADHVMALRGLDVDPAHQRRGVGRKLVEAAIDVATERGKRKLKSRVLGTNEASLALHRRCGFQVEGVLEDEFLLDGAFVDDVLLARRIESS